MQFKITDPKPMRKNTLRGLFSLTIGPMRIEGFSYHIKADKSWIGFPSKEFIDKKTSEKKYWPLVRIENKDRYQSFQRWAKDQVREFFESEPEEEEVPIEMDDIPF